MSTTTPHILVLATEVVPHPGFPTVGGGLRGWTLARGLEAAGIRVTLLVPKDALAAAAPGIAPEALAAARQKTFTWGDPGAAIRQYRPDAVVCCSWFLAARLVPCAVPLAVDLAGPILLEFLYQDPAKAREAAPLKPRGLGAADFVTCAGERQRAYFYPWLTLAGFDQEALATRVATVPISTAPGRAEERSAPQNAEPSILFAGVALPWQDPLVPLQATLEALERRDSGTLDCYLYAHPIHSRGTRWLDWLRDASRERPRLRLHEERLRPYDELLAIYRRADLAFDLFARNPERELAFNTRTVDYLACGLPPLYGDYAELAGPIERYGAGFVVDPGNPAAVQAAVGAALDDRDGLEQRSLAARRLVEEHLTWDRTIEPLARWCAAPTRRERSDRTVGLAALNAKLLADLAKSRATTKRWRQAAEEREQYARHVETAWEERGTALDASEQALVAWRRAPWRTAIRQLLGRRTGRS